METPYVIGRDDSMPGTKQNTNVPWMPLSEVLELAWVVLVECLYAAHGKVPHPHEVGFALCIVGAALLYFCSVMDKRRESSRLHLD